MKLRLAAIWLVLFAVYAGTLGLDSFGSSDYGGDEPHYLLTAKSLVDDGDFDVRNQRADARLGGVLPPVPRPAREAHRRPRARAARRGVPGADRARVRARRREGGGALPGGDRGARRRARLPARAARRARPVGDRRDARGHAVAAVPRVRERGVPRARRRRRARGRRVARAAAAGGDHAPAMRRAASCCSARCRGWARSSCRRDS